MAPRRTIKIRAKTLFHPTLGKDDRIQVTEPLGLLRAEIDLARKICVFGNHPAHASEAGRHLGAGVLAQIFIWFGADHEKQGTA